MRKQNFYTFDYLKERAEFGLREEDFERYKCWFSAICYHQYSTMISLRFSHAMTDPIVVSRTISKIRNAINRNFFRRKKNSTIKMVVVIEADTLKHNDKDSYHAHILITEVVNPQRPFTKKSPHQYVRHYNRLGHLVYREYRRSFMKKIDVNSLDEEQKKRVKVVDGQYKVLLHKIITKTRVNSSNLKMKIRPHFREIDQQEPLIDYLLKKIKKSPSALLVDVENSDLVFEDTDRVFEIIQ